MLRDNPAVTGASPRWISPADVMNSNDVTKHTSSFLIVGDSRREIKLGIGRGLDVEPLNGPECYVLKSVLDMVAWKEGQKVRVKLDLLKYLQRNELVSDFELSETDVLNKLIFDNVPDKLTVTKDQLEALRTEFLRRYPGGAGNFANFGNDRILQAGLGDLASLFGQLPTNVEDLTSSFEKIRSQLNPDNLTRAFDLLAFLQDKEILKVDLTYTKQVLLHAILKVANAEFECSVKASFDNPHGKWPEKIGNVIFVDKDFYFKGFVQGFNEHMVGALDLIAADLMKQATGQYIPLYRSFFETAKKDDTYIFGQKGLEVGNLAFTMNSVVKDKLFVYGDFITYKQKLIRSSNALMRNIADSEKYT